MPRAPRLDFPGALHHVIIRGIERREIFHSDRDRLDLLARLADLTIEATAGLYAWALMPNHVHVLLRTGEIPLSRFVQRWAGPYAGRFNRIHRRAGHLFQNRFKSILVEEEPHLLALVRYIHLNPVNSLLPVGIDTLDHDPWTGHAVLLGNAQLPAQDTDFVLSQFGPSVGRAREAYRQFVRDGAQDGSTVDLEGGGLRRSVGGGWELVRKLGRGREEWTFDERILGGSQFVDEVLGRTQSEDQLVVQVDQPREALDRVIARVAGHFRITPEELRSASLRRCTLDARAIVSHIAVNRYAISLSAAARNLRVSKQSVARALQRAASVFERTGVAPGDFIDE